MASDVKTPAVAAAASTTKKRYVKKDDGRFHCTFPGCDKSYTAKSNFGVHYGDHLPPIPCMLVECGASFTASRFHRDHVVAHTKDTCRIGDISSKDGLYHCRTCSEEFKSAIDTAKHCVEEHTFGRGRPPPSAIPTQRKRSATPSVLASDKQPRGLSIPPQGARKRKADGDHIEPEPEPKRKCKGAEDKDVVRGKDHLFHCTFAGCTSKFNRMQGWKDHYGVHFPPVPCLLRECDQGFTNTPAQRRHTMKHRDKADFAPNGRVHCRLCETDFENASSAAVHCLAEHFPKRKAKKTPAVPSKAPGATVLPALPALEAEITWVDEEGTTLQLRNAKEAVRTKGYFASRDGHLYNKRGARFRQLKEQTYKRYKKVTVRRASDGRTRTYGVHRIVATAWLPNPNNLPEVDHKDRNRANNNVENLEWVTHLENVKRAVAMGRRKTSNGRRIAQYDLHGVLVATFNNSRLATKAAGVKGQALREHMQKGIATNGYVFKWIDLAEPQPDQPAEEWRQVVSSRDPLEYEVSVSGRVRNDRGQLIKHEVDDHGRAYVNLSMGGIGSSITLQVSRLVATAFVKNPDPETLDVVDHIDTNPANNHASNLRWSTQLGNLLNPLSLAKHCRPVEQLDSDGKVIARFDSVLKAAQHLETETGRKADNLRTCISKCLTGNLKTAAGYNWRRAETVAA